MLVRPSSSSAHYPRSPATLLYLAATWLAVVLSVPTPARGQEDAPRSDSTVARLFAAPSSPYPVAPSVVVDARRLGPSPSWSGYVTVRQTRRNDSTAFAVNRVRLTLMAAPRPYVVLRLQGDLANVGRVSGDSSIAAALLTDAFVQLSLPASARADHGAWLARLDPALLVGQFKAPFSLEYLTSFALLRTANRSQVVDRLAVKRDVGVMAQVHATPFVTVAGALVNGEGPGTTRNADGRELAVGRVTLRPLPSLAIAGKWAGQGPEHAWGYDARWLWRGATVEGEAVHRRGDGVADAGGGYALAAYRVLPWLEPLVKWDRYREEGAASEVWLTGGANVGTPDDRVRLQLGWVRKRVRPADRDANELLAQLVALF